MDLVDIDKVLDDFELNEDNSNSDTGITNISVPQNITPSVGLNHYSIENTTTATTTSSSSANTNGNYAADKINFADGLLNQQQQQYNGSRPSSSASPAVAAGTNFNTISSTTKTFVNVSNVFSSLNEYVNAGIDKNLELVTGNTEKLKFTDAAIDDDSSQSSSPDSYIKNEQLNQIETKRDTRKLLPNRDDTSGSNSPGISSRASSQTSSTTSSRRTSLATTPTSSDNEDDEELLTKTNEQSLKPLSNMDSSINTDDFNNHESILQNSEMKTSNTAGINNRTNTVFSSSSSYCYNENNSSDVTFSNDIVSLNETSSLSSLINLSNNESGMIRGTEGESNKNVVDTESLVSDPVLVLNHDNNHIQSIDNSNDVTSGRDDKVVINYKIKSDEEIKPPENVVAEKNYEPSNSQQFIDSKPHLVEVAPKKPVIGFESTMDDVSDTELESYLQELEFETTNSVQNQLSVIKPDDREYAEDVGMQEHIEIDEVANNNIVECDNDVNNIVDDDVNVKELIEKSIENINAQNTSDIIEALTPSTSDEMKEEKNVDNISQASTVECNEIVTSHTDFEEKCISSDEIGVVEESVEALSVDEVAATSDEDLNSILNIETTAAAGSLANQDAPPEPVELSGNSDEMKIDENSDGMNPGTSSSSSQPKRPNTLNFPSPTISEEIPSPGQTPPLKNNPDQLNDQSQLSSSSSDEMTNSSILTQNNLEEMNTSGLPVHQLGKIPPYWVPDSDALNCMHCNMKFSFRKRRHHCRACGKVLCSTCCSIKSKLEYLGDAEARICQQCDVLLKNRDSSINNNSNSNTHAGASGAAGFSRSPNPNNPMEYCSRLPPHQQVAAQNSNAPISVMVPVGVLKREGAPKTTRKEKNVIFSDGIRPGCDLTELDNNWDTKSSSSSYGRKSGSKRVQTPPDPTAKSFRNSIKLPKVDETTNSYIPKEENGLPPIFVSTKTDFDFIDVTNNAQLITRLKQEECKFAVQRNFYVIVKILKLSCCINKTVINFTTQGMRNVGQDEIIILLELDDSNLIPKDVFLHLNELYLNADKGQIITELGFSMPHQINFLGSKEHGGFLYIRPTFQCFQGVAIPESPYLIGILIHRWEVPWAKLFPLRLMLRLGALYRYYPSPHISERGRDSVYAEIAQTVINFLADFRSYTYTLATIRGMTIHMEDRKTTIQIPRNRYDQVIKTINHSSDHILALGGVFSKKADGHLVCIQNTESGASEMYQYSTQAINIQGQPRKVTGASFLILNGALKTTSGLSGKCTIVEDGLMVQILPETMVNAREALKNMKDFNIICGPVDAPPEQQETVSLLWVENDLEFNVGALSPIDNKAMDGVPSIRVHKGLDYSNNNHTIRWTEVFILKSDEVSPHGRDQIDISKVSEKIGRSAAVALVPFLDLLAANGLRKLGLRVTLDQENVCYEAGSQQTKLPPLYMNALDNELIPTLHRQTTSLQTDTPIELELIFHILDK